MHPMFRPHAKHALDGPPRAKCKRGLYQSTIIIAHVKPAMADGREAPRQVSEQKWTTLWMDVGRLLENSP